MGMVIALSGDRAHAQANAKPTESLPNPYKVIENHFKLPEGRTLGSTPAIEIDRDGRSIWVFERCGRASGGTPCADSPVAPILKFDPSGTLVKSFGDGMFVNPHGIHVDGQGNLWVTDGSGKDAKGQQVFEFSPDGRVLMRLGKAGVAGDGPDTFNQPSDVQVAPGGDIFVADGHGGNSNARIVKFSKDGTFIKSWGRKGSGPGEFDTPHSLAMDKGGRLFVADRGNSRIQIFDQDGKFLAEWKQFGRPSGVYVDANDAIYVADSQTVDKTGCTTDQGCRRGIRIGNAADGSVKYFIPRPNGDAVGPEGVSVDAQGTVYGASNEGKRIDRFTRK
jgi:sugar lactone lactonase YvrE